MAEAPGRTSTAARIAARVDRLPLTRVQWELAILTQIAWGLIVLDTDGIPAKLYPFIWKPQHLMTTFQYAVIQALAVGLGILIGDFLMGFVSDHFGRRPALIASALLAGMFVWPFAIVTNYTGLVIVSVLSTLGVGGILATHSVYIAEVTSPETRNRVMLASQSTTAFIGVGVGLLAFFWIPSHYAAYIYVAAGSQLLFLLPLLIWRLPESPRWLEAMGKHQRAEHEMTKLEERTRHAYGAELPEVDEAVTGELVESGHGFDRFKELITSPVYRPRMLRQLAAWIMGYAGIIYGAGAFVYVYMVDKGAGAHFVFMLATVAGVITFFAFHVNSFLRERVERKQVIFWVAMIFAVPYTVMYFAPGLAVIAACYLVGRVGSTLWLFNMYNYTSVSFPTRLRSVAMGTADGLGHMGAWGGVTLLGHLYTAGPNHLGWFAFVIVIGAMVPAVLIAGWGIKQSSVSLETVAA